eukprot:3750507-Ditylum_brightwellii.AAC.1
MKIVEEVHGDNLMLVGTEQKSMLNFCIFEFLGLACNDSGSQSLKSQSKAVLNTYGCGSCGPCGLIKLLMHICSKRKP